MLGVPLSSAGYRATVVGTFLRSGVGETPLGGIVLNVVGNITDAAGAPLNGTYTVRFELRSGPVGASTDIPLWSDSYSMTLTQGGFSVALGATEAGHTPMPLFLFDGRSLNLLVSVGGEAMTPRLMLGEVPTATVAARGGPTFAVPTFAQPPSCGAPGQLYFDATQKAFFGCDGTTWRALSR